MKIYNTATRQKEELMPRQGSHIGIYACGPTVYNFIHIGNARPLVVFDVLRRYLAWRGYEVTFVQNFTDIDDKMISRAAQEGTTVKALAKRYIAEYERDARGLNVLPADIHPRATDHIAEIIALIRTLEQKGLAYASDGDVYFDTAAFPGYGKLSGQAMEDLMNGARVEVDERKRSPMDFALWKAEKPGEPSWGSPWGKGRPGWHIECSAMSMKYLGHTVDIHCGGTDLIFPHHENEIAQSEGATGEPFVRYWMHNGHINVDNRKMSKSLGNFFTVREIGEEFPLEVVRVFMLSAHYRSPVNFSREQLKQCQAALDRLYTARDSWSFQAGQAADDPSADMGALTAGMREAFVTALEDDLNTADALSVLFEFVRDANSLLTRSPRAQDAAAALAALGELADVLGILTRPMSQVPAEVQILVDRRAAARAARDWTLSDSLRDELVSLGWQVEDTADGQKVRPV